MYRHDYGPYWEHARNGHPFAWLFAFLIFALVVGVIAALVVRWLNSRRGGVVASSPVGATVAGSVADALAVVQMRYARGEIDREQFLQVSGDLGGASPAA